MTISINTSEYIKYKEVIIDGVKLGLRMMNSAETLALMSLQREIKEKDANQTEIVERLVEMFFNLYDNPEKARGLLGKLSIDALSDIYKRVMESDNA